MISDALTMLAAPPQEGAGGSVPPQLPAEGRAPFLPLLQQATAPPGAGPPKAPGARTALPEGADKDKDTDSAETAAAPAAPPADPLAAALLQASLPVPTAGAPTHTDDAQGQGAGAHDARTAPSGPARPIAGARVELPQLPQEAAVDAARPAADPVARTAAQAHAQAQTGGTAAAGPVEHRSAGARGATDPVASLLQAATKKAAGHRHAPVDAIRSAVQEAVRAVAEPAPLGAAVDAPAAPAVATLAGHASAPTAHSRLGDLPAAAATLLEVAASARATRARIVLTPPELGKVEIRLRYGANGVSATFHADSPEAAQSLAGAAGDLRRSLEQQGIQVSRIDVPTTTAAGADQQGSPWLAGGDASPGFGRPHHGDRHGPADPSLMSFETAHDQTTLRTVLLGTAVDVLA